MRGDDQHPEGMFSYRRPEERIPADHPLRPMRAMVDTALRELSLEFARLSPKTGRPSVPPEKLPALCCSSCATLSTPTTVVRKTPKSDVPCSPTVVSG
jgi:hypothetical protein